MLNKKLNNMNEILLKTIIAEFSKQSTTILKDIKGETNHFFNDGLSNYLEKQRAKFVNIKTLLHRTTPVPFYDIYLPTRLSCRNKSIETSSINRVFWETQFVTIIGDAGSGKSTLIKHLFLNSISEKFCIPILIELRYLNDYKGSIEDYIRENIFENKLSPTEKILNRLLENGKFVFFLDGYDEIKSDSKKFVVEKLNAFIDKYRLNRFLLTSRPYSNIELLPLFHNYRIEKLNDVEIKKFISIQKIESELAQKIIKSVSENKVLYLKSYLTNPLLLSLYILTFSTNSSIPDKKYIFYRRVLDVLFKEHDSITKIGYERELKTKLSQEGFEEILKIFSFISYFDSEYDFTKDYLFDLLNKIKEKRTSFNFDNNDLIEDLKSAIALWTEDSGVYSFAHRSMQEYFAALYIKGINDNKKDAYKKIHSKLFENRRNRETANFLSLCDEMDSYNYKKYMLLPTLKSINKKINRQDDRTIIKSCLLLFFSNIEFEISSTESRMVSLSGVKGSSKYLFAVEKFEGVFVNEIFKRGRTKSIFDKVKKNKVKVTSRKSDSDKDIFTINFKNLDENDLELLSTTELLKFSKQFSEHVITSIQEIETFLKESNEYEKNLIELI